MLLSDIIFISQLPLFTQLQTFSLCVGLFLEKCYILSQDLLLYSSQVWGSFLILGLENVAFYGVNLAEYDFSPLSNLVDKKIIVIFIIFLFISIFCLGGEGRGGWEIRTSDLYFIRRDLHHNVNTLIAVDDIRFLQLAPKAQIAFENENN